MSLGLGSRINLARESRIVVKTLLNGSVPGVIPGPPKRENIPTLSQNLVSIENGSKRFTTLGRAISFVKRGHAEWIEPQKRIRFIELGKRIRYAQEQVEEHLLDDRGGVVFWNGSSEKEGQPNPRCIPGQVRS